MSSSRLSVRARLAGAIAGVLPGVMQKRRESLYSTPVRLASVERLEDRVLFAWTPNLCLPGGGISSYTPTPPGTCTDCSCTQEPVQSSVGGDGGNPQVLGYTAAPVRYFDGQPKVDVTDLSSDGFGTPWGQTRSFDDASSGINAGYTQGANGNRWTLMGTPHLLEATSGSVTTLIAVSSGMDQRWYDSADSGVTYTARDFIQDSLTYNSSTHEYVLSDSSGGQTYFFDFSNAQPLQQGQFEKYVDAAGNLTTATYAGSSDPDGVPAGRMKSITRSSAGATETWKYSYLPSTNPDNPGLISKVQLLRGVSNTVVRQANYFYYNGSNSSGNAHDLQSVQIRDGSGPASPAASLSATGGTLAANTTYFYEVTAVTASGETAASDEVRVTTDGTGTQKATLSWTAVTGATSYNVYRSTSSGNEVRLATGVGSSPYTDTGGATPGTAVPPNIDVNYYRYYTNTTNGYVGGLKYVFNSQSYARALAASVDPYAGSDAAVAPYADNYFEYDNNHRVTKEVAQGAGCSCTGATGQGTFTYSYSTDANVGYSDSYSNWKYKTVETFLDGVTTLYTNTVYANYRGEVMLKAYNDVTDPGNSALQGKTWDTAYSYDASGRLTTVASPAAVTGFNDTQVGLGVTMNAGSGLVQKIDYYSTTTASANTGSSSSGAGGVAGFFQDTYLQQGQFGLSLTTLTHSGTTATATASAAHGFQVGQSVIISGASPAAYDGTFVIVSVPSSTTFTYTMATTPASNASGTMYAALEDLQESRTYFRHSFTPTGSVATGTVFLVATDVVYGGEGATDARTTSYAYTFQAESGHPANYTNRYGTMTTTLPVIASGQNGPGVADSTTDTLDAYGRITQYTDGDGYNTTYQYDDGTGAMTQRVVDAGVGHLALTTNVVVDGLGRTTKVTDPNANVSYMVYNDLNHEIRVYSGFNGSTTTGPIVVAREYRPAPGSGGTVYEESLTSSVTPHLTGGVPDGTETLASANIQTLSRSLTNNSGQIVKTDAYFSLNSVTYSTATAQLGSGSNSTSSGNYHETQYEYDEQGRVERTQSPTGTITRTVYDDRGRLVSTWVGTNDTTGNGSEWSPTNQGTANLMDVGDYQYDANGVGNGDLTQTIAHPGGGATDRTSQFAYDWRDRQISAKGGVQVTEATTVHRPIAYTVYNNRGAVIEQDRYDGDTVQLASLGLTNGVPNRPSSSLLRTKVVNSVDDQGRVYLSQTYSVDQGETGGTAGTVGAALSTKTFYDHRGDVVAVYAPGGVTKKDLFDGAGRVSKESLTDGGAVAGAAVNWANATSLSNDDVLSQTLATYDANGNPTLVTSKQRFDNDSNASTGDLGSPSAGVGARDSYAAMYYDAANRLTASVNVGTNGGSAYTRPGSVPARSDTVLVTSTNYDSAGRAYQVYDPRNILTLSSFDMLGRTTQVIQASDGASPSDAGDQTTNYTYDGDNHVLTMQAVMPSGGSDPASETTAYVYGVGSVVGTDLFSNDLIAKTEYPDKTTGAASTSAANDESYTYDLRGEKTSLTDRNGSVHAYTFDVLGRLTLDAVTTLAAGVDGTIRAQGYSYDTGGRLYQATSYSNAAGTTVVSQLQRAYEGLGQLAVEYQEHAGAVNTGTSKNVQYNYTQMAGGQNNDRLVSMVYPNGRVLDYVYGATEYPLTGITHSGTTATATMGSNVYSVGNTVTISGATPSAYDGTFTVTAVNTTSHTFNYTMGSTPASNATGADLTVTSSGASLDDKISRITSLMDHGGTSAGVHLEEYSYLGLSTIVTFNRPEDHTQLTYVQVSGDTHANSDGGDRYTGLDRFGRVIDQYWLNTASSPNAIDRFQYAYDRDNNVLYKNNLGPNGTSINASTLSELYHTNSSASGDNATAYDNLDRLTAMRRGTLSASANNGGVLDTVTTVSTLAGSTKAWGLDALGNWNSVTTDGAGQTRTQNSQNQLKSISGNSTAGGAAVLPTYDNNGNTTKNDTGFTFTYDAWNRLITTVNGTTSTLGYDALGRFKTYNQNNTGVSDFFLDSQGRIIQNATSPVYNQYVYGLGYVNEVILRDRNKDRASGGNYGLTGSGEEERVYSQQDANWNVTSLMTPDGTVQERIVYDAYGTPTTLNSQWAATADTQWFWRPLYQGTYWLAESDTYLMGARAYSYTLGRFMQNDPTGGRYVDGADLYQVVDSNPVDYVDPTGLAGEYVFPDEPVGWYSDPIVTGKMYSPYGPLERPDFSNTQITGTEPPSASGPGSGGPGDPAAGGGEGGAAAAGGGEGGAAAAGGGEGGAAAAGGGEAGAAAAGAGGVADGVGNSAMKGIGEAAGGALSKVVPVVGIILASPTTLGSYDYAPSYDAAQNPARLAAFNAALAASKCCNETKAAVVANLQRQLSNPETVTVTVRVYPAQDTNWNGIKRWFGVGGYDTAEIAVPNAPYISRSILAATEVLNNCK